jgi:hypothetical protein
MQGLQKRLSEPLPNQAPSSEPVSHPAARARPCSHDEAIGGLRPYDTSTSLRHHRASGLKASELNAKSGAEPGGGAANHSSSSPAQDSAGHTQIPSATGADPMFAKQGLLTGAAGAMGKTSKGRKGAAGVMGMAGAGGSDGKGAVALMSLPQTSPRLDAMLQVSELAAIAHAHFVEYLCMYSLSLSLNLCVCVCVCASYVCICVCTCVRVRVGTRGIVPFLHGSVSDICICLDGFIPYYSLGICTHCPIPHCPILIHVPNPLIAAHVFPLLYGPSLARCDVWPSVSSVSVQSPYRRCDGKKFLIKAAHTS